MMDRWIDVQMDRQIMDRQTDRWMNRQIDRCGYMDRLVDRYGLHMVRWIDRQMDAFLFRIVNKWLDKCMKNLYVDDCMDR